MSEMSDEIKHLPDFYTSKGYLVEVIGCGKDRIAKFRTSKFRALDTFWREVQPLAIFVWNSTYKTWVLVFWPEFSKAYIESIDEHGVKEFHDGNKYVPLKLDRLIELSAAHGELDE